jgi:hypothetical protein
MPSTQYKSGNYQIEPQSGFISEGNSTVTPLGISGVFTGEWEDVSQFSSLSLVMLTDRNSGTGGIQLEFSCDGVNIDRIKTYTFSANNSQAHSLAIVSQYFRIVYTNGVLAQTFFRMQVLYHVNRQRQLTSGTEQALNQWDDVTLFRSVNEPEFDRNIGRIAYESTVHKFGTNAAISTTYEDIWTNGGVYPWPTAAETVRVKTGGNVNDIDSTGSGARKIVVVGLNENWEQVSEEIALNGSSVSSATTITFIRIFSAYVTDCGTYTGSNTGIILIENTSSTNVICSIDATIGRSQQTMYTVPAGKTAYIVRLEVQAEITNTAEVRLFRRENADTIAAPFNARNLIHRVLDFSGSETIVLKSYEMLPEKTDVWADAKKATGGGDTEVEVEFDIWLVDNAI